jgi:hypothetical protein
LQQALQFLAPWAAKHACFYEAISKLMFCNCLEAIMNVGAVPHQAFPTFDLAINASRDGRMSLPVAPGMVIYSHFRHVSGTPAPEGTTGVNISKLKILDTLIEQLNRIKKQAAMDANLAEETDENRINALIEQYQQQIKAAQSVSIYTPVAPETGALFNIAA